jgi:hypothetical protein
MTLGAFELLDILSLVSLNIVSHIFPTLIVDFFKYLNKKKLDGSVKVVLKP